MYRFFIYQNRKDMYETYYDFTITYWNTYILFYGKNNSTIMGIGGAFVCGGTAYGLLKGRNDNTAHLSLCCLR